jgi:hypothetical protein
MELLRKGRMGFASKKRQQWDLANVTGEIKETRGNNGILLM